MTDIHSEPHSALGPPQGNAPLAYDARTAAIALSVSKATVWRLIAAGELRTFKLGHRTLMRAEELRALIERKSA